MTTAQLQQNERVRLNHAAVYAWPGNKGGPDWAIFLLIIICLVLLISGFYGCRINRATQKVPADCQAFNKVVAAWAKLNPCIVYSTKNLVHDTNISTNTAFKLVPNTAATVRTALANHPGADDALVQPITKTVILHDSVKIVPVDERKPGICFTWLYNKASKLFM